MPVSYTHLDYDATVDMFNGLKATLTTALTKIRAAELEAVEKAINAIPLNITLDDKTTIEAARKAYDAFVEEWTSYADPVFNAAAAVDNFRELALAEAALSILEKDAAIKATEALKMCIRDRTKSISFSPALPTVTVYPRRSNSK